MQKLFTITARGVIQPVGILSGVAKEAELRDIAADNLGALFGIRFFDKEYRIDDMRIDTVGISEDNCPVLIEYKKGKDSNVVTQILSYYHGFMENKADFRWQVSQDPNLGSDIAKKLDFKNIRLICLAGEFSKYDLRAWRSHQQIELVTYRYFDNNTLLLEWKEGGGGRTRYPSECAPNVPTERFEACTFTSPTASSHRFKSEEDPSALDQHMRQRHIRFV